MSYASRLVAMTRPAALPRGNLREIVETKQVNAEPRLPAPEPRERAGGEPRATTPVRAASPMQASTESLVRRNDMAARPSQAGHDGAAVRQAASTPAEEQPVPSSHRFVPAPDWLADEPNIPDPLESIAANDDIRELLRSVRQWTRTAPVPAPSPHEGPEQLVVDVPSPAPAGAMSPMHDVAAIERAQPAERRDDPVQVSIGNVTITVEDAPSAPASRQSPARTAADPSSRLARHYLRGV